MIISESLKGKNTK